MKVYLIFVFLLAAPALVRLVSNEAPTTATAPRETPALPEKPAIVEAESAKSAAQAPAVKIGEPPATKDRPLSQSVPPSHTFYFM